jgi:hypothetical protein
MPSQTLYARDLESYIPILDPRRLAKPAVIDGKNFVFDVDGPRSAFDTEFYNWVIATAQTIALCGATSRSRTRFGTVRRRGFGGLCRFHSNPSLCSIFQSAPLYKFWPWTSARWARCTTSRSMTRGFPVQSGHESFHGNSYDAANRKIRGVTESYGRLVCLSDTTVFWSALDDGTDLIPSLTNRAGFEPLSMLSRKAYRVDPVADGVIVTTDKGYLKGEFVAAGMFSVGTSFPAL